MSDDFLVGVPVDDVLGDAAFDPNAIDSDAFLDDTKDILGVDVPDDILSEDDDGLLDE